MKNVIISILTLMLVSCCTDKQKQNEMAKNEYRKDSLFNECNLLAGQFIDIKQDLINGCDTLTASEYSILSNKLNGVYLKIDSIHSKIREVSTLMNNAKYK